MRRAPIALKDGHHLKFHIRERERHPNCTTMCSKFDSIGRDLTHEEYTAWTPHLGHWSKFHEHIPRQYHALLPPTPLENVYDGPLPSHPLPTLSSSSSVPYEAMSSMTIMASGSGSGRFTPGKLLFIESPRLQGPDIDLAAAMTLITYDRYVVGDNTPQRIRVALRTAPPGFAYREIPDEEEENREVESYQIHDMASDV
jgi:hypothetical protein